MGKKYKTVLPQKLSTYFVLRRYRYYKPGPVLNDLLRILKIINHPQQRSFILPMKRLVRYQYVTVCITLVSHSFFKVRYRFRKQPYEEEPKLPLQLAKPLYNLVMSMNTNPVRYLVSLTDRAQSCPCRWLSRSTTWS